MASANLELVQSLYAAWGRGDWSAAEWAHPEIEFAVGDGPETDTRKGVSAMAEGWRDFLSNWEAYKVEPEDYRELDAERVLVLVSIGGRGRSSGLEVGQVSALGANLFHLREGKVTRLVIYFNHEHALSDLGLS